MSRWHDLNYRWHSPVLSLIDTPYIPKYKMQLALTQVPRKNLLSSPRLDHFNKYNTCTQYDLRSWGQRILKKEIMERKKC